MITVIEKPRPMVSSRSEHRLTLVPLLIAFAIGIASATQIAMVGALSRQRGIPEATWISMLATITGIALVIGVRAWRGETPALPSPITPAGLFLVVSGIAAVLLVLSLRGLAPYYGITGLFAVAFLLGTAAVVPKIGVALFFIVNASGSLLGAVIFDHIGAFGAVPNPVTPMRLIGFVVVLAGILVVRFAR